MAIDIDEEIKKAREVAERIQKQADKQKGLNHGYYIFNSELANEYRQRAEWLEELKCYRNNNDFSEYADRLYKIAYNRAIDDFADKISIYGTYDDYGNVIDILEIAEKFKAGGIDERS